MIAVMLTTGGRCPHEGLQTGVDNRLEAHFDPAIHTSSEFQDSFLDLAQQLD